MIQYVIENVHMGYGHDGLQEILTAHRKKNPLFSRALTATGGLILFVNKAKTKVKLMHENGACLAYLRIPAHLGLCEESIRLIPATFGGSLGLSQAVKKALRGYHEVRPKQRKDESRVSL